MKLLLKILKWAGIVIVIIIAAFVIFVLSNSSPTFDAPYPEITASTDSAVIARGKYLVNGAAHCAHCHAPTSQFADVEMGKQVPLSGGFNFILPIGTVFAPNITSDVETGIGGYSDQEIARAMRHGVKKNGEALMDFMPFYDLSDEDLTAIISFLRTTGPVKMKSQENDWNFLGKMVWAMGGIKPMGDSDVPPMPSIDSSVVYGKYLVESVANCVGCHTNRDLMTGGFIGPKYAGNFIMETLDESGNIDQTRHVITPNLTPDPETGIMATWSQQDFLDRFRQGRVISGSPMPWGPFSRLSEVELVAVYKFLRTLEPVESNPPRGVQPGPAPGY